MICIVLVMSLLSANAQDYIASNGVSYSEGDTVYLDAGSSPDGKFNHIEMRGAHRTPGDSDYRAKPKYAGSAYIVKKVRSKRFGMTEKMLIYTERLLIYIDDAISSCEVVPCWKDD